MRVSIKSVHLSRNIRPIDGSADISDILFRVDRFVPIYVSLRRVRRAVVARRA